MAVIFLSQDGAPRAALPHLKIGGHGPVAPLEGAAQNVPGNGIGTLNAREPEADHGRVRRG